MRRDIETFATPVGLKVIADDDCTFKLYRGQVWVGTIWKWVGGWNWARLYEAGTSDAWHVGGRCAGALDGAQRLLARLHNEALSASAHDIEVAESIARVAEGNPHRGRSGFASLDEVQALRRVIDTSRKVLDASQGEERPACATAAGIGLAPVGNGLYGKRMGKAA